jgi:hypothetical protein
MIGQKFQPKQQNNDRLANYVEVNERIHSFWLKHPNGRIHTEIVSWQDGILVMRAMVWRDMNDQYPCAVGHTYEIEGSSHIVKGSILEVAETSVVGRALAIAGEMVKRSVASKEEVENAISHQTELENEPDRSNDPAIKAKWELLAGNLDGYADGVKKLRDKGMTWAQIETVLIDKIKQKQKNADGESK